MKPGDRNLMSSLDAFLRGQICIVGVGNRQRRDDGAGPRVIDARRPGAPGVWIDAGVAPENFLEPIVRTNPDSILIVDAVAFGGSPGQCRLMDVMGMDMAVISTHALSLGMLGQYLSARTNARLQLIAIQPESIEVGEGLSHSVENTVRELTAVLSDLLESSNKGTGHLTGRTLVQERQQERAAGARPNSG